MLDGHARFSKENSALYKMSVDCFADLAAPFQRLPQENLLALLRHTELGATNAHYAFLQRPNAHRYVSPGEWKQFQGRCSLRPEAQPIVILQPKGPIGFRFDIADLQGDPSAVLAIATRKRHSDTAEENLLTRLADLALKVSVGADKAKAQMLGDDWHLLARWISRFDEALRRKDIGGSVLWLADAAASGIPIYDFRMFADPRKREHRDAGFDREAIAAVVMARLKPSGTPFTAGEELAKSAATDLDCYFIACAANRICSLLLHSERSLREQERDG